MASFMLHDIMANVAAVIHISARRSCRSAVYRQREAQWALSVRWGGGGSPEGAIEHDVVPIPPAHPAVRRPDRAFPCPSRRGDIAISGYKCRAAGPAGLPQEGSISCSCYGWIEGSDTGEKCILCAAKHAFLPLPEGWRRLCSAIRVSLTAPSSSSGSGGLDTYCN